MDLANEHCGYIIMKINEALNEMATESLDEHGITFSQMRFVHYMDLHRDRPVTLKEMEKYYGMAQPTVAGIMKKLERKGYVTLIPDPNDRRAKNVVLTAEGLALIESQNRFRESLEERFLEPLSEEERKEFHELLTRVGSNICKEAGRE